MRIAVVTVRRSFSWSICPALSCPLGYRCAAKLIEPRLHTAISLSLVFKVVSVHKLELCTTPTCCCGERMLQGSLKVIHGWPVSNSIVNILRHRLAAGTSVSYTHSEPTRLGMISYAVFC